MALSSAAARAVPGRPGGPAFIPGEVGGDGPHLGVAGSAAVRPFPVAAADGFVVTGPRRVTLLGARWPYDGAVLVKWMRCTVGDRRGFERGQRKWAGLLGEPGFRGQGGGWSRARSDVVHVFAFWESRAFYDSFMERSHDRLHATQADTYTDAQVRIFNYRFDVKTGFRPVFTDTDLLRVAHCRVREDRIEHYMLMQEKVWNPAMAGSPGMLRGAFTQADREDEFMVLSMWNSAAEHGKYRTERVERLAFRAQVGADVTAIAGDVIDLEPAWTV